MSLTISWATEDEQVAADGSLTLSSSFHILEFDVVTAVEHTAESELTEHVVESSEAISDHKRPKPRMISIRAHVTNTPLSNPPNSGFAQTSVTSRVTPDTGDSKATVRSFSSEFDRIQDVETSLDRLRSEAIDLTVETRTKTYENVQLVTYTGTRSTETGDGIDLALQLREVFRASTQTVEAPLPREPRAAPATETAAEGEEEDVDTDEGLRSTLFSLGA